MDIHEVNVPGKLITNKYYLSCQSNLFSFMIYISIVLMFDNQNV